MVDPDIGILRKWSQPKSVIGCTVQILIKNIIVRTEIIFELHILNL